MTKFLFSSEQVSDGHPDKMSDYISDSILDACLEQDPKARVAVETLVKNNTVVVAGEVTFKGEIDIDAVVRAAIQEIGYDEEATGMDYRTCNIINLISEQSPEIANAVHVEKKPEDVGAGDQGLMIGYATDETEEALPMSYVLATKILLELHKARKEKTIEWLRPDMKSQVTVQYQKSEDQGLIPLRIHTVLVSLQHAKTVDLNTIQSTIKEQVLLKILPENLVDENTRYFINPSGSFVVGGPKADAGVTGRKIIADTYGGWGGHGGGAFSGKDSTKVDRSAAYASRQIAKSLVKADFCRRCLVKVAYGIGVVEPISLYVDTFGSAKHGLSDADLIKIIEQNFDLRPGMIMKNLGLEKPIFRKSTLFGHFVDRPGAELPWEQVVPLKKD